MNIPTIEQVKIQALALVPLVKALQAELGEERANAIVRLADFAMAGGYGAKVQLKRTQTIMQGASHCDFRYVLEKPGGPQ